MATRNFEPTIKAKNIKTFEILKTAFDKLPEAVKEHVDSVSDELGGTTFLYGSIWDDNKPLYLPKNPNQINSYEKEIVVSYDFCMIRIPCNTIGRVIFID